MINKKIYVITIAAMLVGCSFISCKEDALTPDYEKVETMFQPASSDQSDEAQLRQQFFNETGSYLLFNDTLKHTFLGYDFNGDPTYSTELLAMEYEVGSSYTGETTYYYTYLTTIDEKRQAVQYLKEDILSHLTGKLKPYSWFLPNRIYCKNTSGKTTYTYVLAGERAIAVACYQIPTFTEAKRKSFTQQIMSTIIDKVTSNNSSSFGTFYAVCESLYDGTFDQDGTTADNTLKLNQAGFTVKGKDYGMSTNGIYPSREDDLAAFARMAIRYTREEMETKYTDFPIILQKDNIMRETLTSLGYKF